MSEAAKGRDDPRADASQATRAANEAMAAELDFANAAISRRLAGA